MAPVQLGLFIWLRRNSSRVVAVLWACGAWSIVAGSVGLWVLLTADRAVAHPGRSLGSIALVDFKLRGAQVEWRVPLDELQHFLSRPLIVPGESPQATVGRERAVLVDFARTQLHVTDAGRSWRSHLVAMHGYQGRDGIPRVRFELVYAMPAELAASPGDVVHTLRLDARSLSRGAPDHLVRVYLRTAWSRGLHQEPPQLVGLLGGTTPTLVVEAGGTFWDGFEAIVVAGLQHIASGADHLLFLCALLLVAPVLASCNRWRRPAPVRLGLVRLLSTVTAFTVGHSVALVAGAQGGQPWPAIWTERLIAISLVVSAVHALRPLFAGREALAAGLFGLVHGLAFAESLLRYDLEGVQALWTLLAFNIGVEIGQLAVVLLLAPWLLWLSRTRFFPAFRVTVALLTLILAVGWLVERTANDRILSTTQCVGRKLGTCNAVPQHGVLGDDSLPFVRFPYT